ncbi:MFS transporter [Actinomadura atramentaria]|uniref:MFS transporter n=1 Tax=Actinomadura atramentaria TaxID=1990 RepID=UPI00039DD3FE|nr:MFS transporter [Actinomadura atramentaria]
MTTAHLPERVGAPRAGRPAGPRPRWRRLADPRHPVTAATLFAAVLHLVWARWLAAEGGDLAAQAFWTHFAGEHPGSAYNLAWYGGIHPVSYSVLSPYIMAWFGIRTVATVAGTLSATLAAVLLVRFRAPATLPAALWAAFAISCNAGSGRVTFGLGLAFALLAVLIAFTPHGRPVPRAAGMFALGLLATLASPVAGLFLMVVSAALILTGRWRAGVAIGAGPPLVVGVTTALFPFTGVQPIGFGSIVAPAMASVLALLLCAPRSWRIVRIGAGVYAVGVLLTYLIPSPIGSNVERLSLLFGGMLLLSAIAGTTRLWRLAVMSVAFVVSAAWMMVKPIDDIIHTRPAAATAGTVAGLRAELDRYGADRGRIEVVPLRSHWETSGLARNYLLARGWNRQVDAERYPLFYDEGALTPASYHAWLRTWAVRFVVLPEQETDWAATGEAGLVRAGQPYLREVYRDAYWRLYAVADAVPLVELPSTVARARADELAVDVPSRGSVLIRVAWSPWLGVTGTGGGCLERDGEFVRLHAPGPGRYTIGARYRLPRGTPCPR